MCIEYRIEKESRPGRGPYRRRSLEEKRRIVEQCLRPGASVAGVALAHGANANLVRKWIAKYRAGEYGKPGAALLPVSVRAEPALKPATGEAVVFPSRPTSRSSFRPPGCGCMAGSMPRPLPWR